MQTPSRRGFVLGGAALGVLGITGLAGCGGDAEPTGSTTGSTGTTDATVALSPPPPAAAPPEDFISRVGEGYRSAVPDEDDLGTLESLVPELAGLTPAGAVAALPQLEPTVREDFGAGRTVEVNGWVLSETEGRASALISVS